MTTFVVSTGRCGSTSLCTWLQQHDVRAVMEPYAERLIKMSVEKAETGKASPAAVKLLGNIARVHAGGCVVDNNLSLFVDELADICPCRFIWLIRDPWDCISSLMAWKWYRDPHEIDENDVFARNRLDAVRIGDLWPEDCGGASKLGKCAWYWQWLNRRIEEQLHRRPEDQWIRVRLEDWSPAVATTVLAFVGAGPYKMMPELPTTNVGRWNDERPKWTDDEVALVQSIARTAVWRWYPEAHYKTPLTLAKWKAKEAEKALAAG